MEREIIKIYDSIIFDLFIVMLVMLVYLFICGLWIFAIVFSLLVLGSYLVANKKIKEIKQSLS